ncbi:probable WRKY transcription factor 41 [Zingiber officinale]|uniref:probable WRKY transcription factor 41 n=1 Tax=Zingiber officinale TaxID=94328 RepID=UPI001C4CBFB2|nr:probable WRKY transcription factor 41 [Zingiber officinale]
MEATADDGWDFDALVAALTQGEEQLRQLCASIAERSPAEQEKKLALGAHSCFKKAICIAQAMDSGRLRAASASDSPRSNSCRSPQSDSSERAVKEHERKEMCKKRKTLRKWTSRVRVSGSDGHDDGFSWRKYGQKDILGANHPRAYYRCTYRNATGCLAMKQVQRADDDPSVVDVTYRGEHTCLQNQRPKPSQGSLSVAEEKEAPQDQQLLLNFQASLKVETEGLSSDNSFSFASTPVSGGFSPSFVSPATPESSNFLLSPWRMSGIGDLFSAVAPADAYGSDVGFMLDSAGFDETSPFEAADFFPDL